MNRKIFFTLLAAGAVSTSVFAISSALASNEKAAAHAADLLCPLTGEPIDPSIHVATDGGPAYFCCLDCVKKFKKNPKKYAAKVASQRAELAKLPKVQVNCPVSGEAVDQKVMTRYEGKDVHFCCNKCKAKFEANPSAFKAKLANSYSIQTKCPLTDEPIDPAVFVETSTGQRVYFCCNKCKGKYKANPASFKAKLKALNIDIDPKTVEKGS